MTHFPSVKVMEDRGFDADDGDNDKKLFWSD